jgi:hypothetical protein
MSIPPFPELWIPDRNNERISRRKDISVDVDGFNEEFRSTRSFQE